MSVWPWHTHMQKTSAVQWRHFGISIGLFNNLGVELNALIKYVTVIAVIAEVPS